MKKTASPALIGAFVLGALAIAVAGILIFGGGSLFQRHIEYVMYFTGSVKGLPVGAPVTFKGVKVGNVTDIKVTVDSKTDEIRIPVFIRLEPDRVTADHRLDNSAMVQEYIDGLVGKGLRGQLQLQSLVTGQLMIHLDFYPDRKAVYAHPDGKIPELPTVPSNFEELSRSFEKLPIQEILDKMLSALEGIESFVNSTDLKEGTHALNLALQELQTLVTRLNSNLSPLVEKFGATSASLQKLIEHVDSQIDPIAENIENTGQETQRLLRTATSKIEEITPKLSETAKSTQQTLAEIRTLVELKEGPAAETVAQLTLALEASRQTMARADKLIDELGRSAAGGSAMHQDINRAMYELTEAARSVRILAEFLQKHPESLIRGKGTAQ